MKILKKSISLILMLVIIVGMVPVRAAASDDGISASGTCGEHLTWTLSEDGVLTISGEGDMPYFTTAPWNDYADQITKVVIREGVTSIADYSFRSCSRLTEAVIADTVTAIGGDAFNASGLKSVTIPAGITSIGYYAFAHCYSLKEVRFMGDAPTYFGKYAFDGITLTAYYPTNNITWTENAKQGYGGNVTWVAYDVEPEETTPDETIPDAGNVVSGECGEDGDNLTWTLNMNTGVLTISGVGEMDFYSLAQETPWHDYHKQIETVVVEQGVTSIGRYAFGNCIKLTKVILPDSLKKIDWQVFSGCTNLAEIDIPDSVSSIGGWAFQDCIALTEIALPASLSSIGPNPFVGCKRLEKITVPEENWFFSTDSNSVLFNKSKTELIACPTTYVGYYVVPSSVTQILENAFDGCEGLSGIELPEGIKKIAGFSGCTGLSKVTLPDSLAEMGAYTFSECANLEKIILSDSLEYIPEGCFYYCTALKEITIPASVEHIDRNAFYYCESLTKIIFEGDAPLLNESISLIDASAFSSITATAYYPAGNTTWSEITMKDYGGTIIWVASDETAGDDEHVVSGFCGTGVKWTLDTTTGILTISGDGEIADYLLDDIPWNAYRDQVRTVAVESGVTNVNAYAFYRCVNLEKVTLSDTVTSIEMNAFNECGKLPEIDIPESVTHIGFGAFRSCNSLTEIHIPSAVTSIGNTPFACCKNLKRITVAEGNVYFAGDSIGGLYNKDKNVLLAVPGGYEGEYVVADGVTEIGTQAFDGCEYLTGVVIPESVKKLGVFTFVRCPALNTATFEGNAPEIGSNTFYDITATAYYPAGNATWTGDVMQNYGGKITWKPAGESQQLGDPNGDGKVNAKDSTLILQYSVGILKNSATFELSFADVNKDGKINAKDSTLILQFSVGLRDSFPAQK